MYLVEASRGCQWGCRFCAAGFMYRPIRYRSPEHLIEEAERGLTERSVIGLVGAEMASVPGVAEIAESIADAGGRLSPSSLKADCISPQLAAALARNGNHSVTVAPEAGSERMRKVINKNLTENEILEAAEMMVGTGVENLKLYFMVGLPEEREHDVREIAHLTGKILARARAQKKSVGHVTVSLNPFVPKPWTPFQWDPMEDAARHQKQNRDAARRAVEARPGRARRGIAARGIFPDPGFAGRSARRRDPRTPRRRADAKARARSGMSSKRIAREGAASGLAGSGFLCDASLRRRRSSAVGLHRPSHSQMVPSFGTQEGALRASDPALRRDRCVVCGAC